MRSRYAWTVASVLTVILLSAETALAQQTVNFSLGGFFLRGEDARVEGCEDRERVCDVLVENRSLYLFDFSDFNTFSVGAEWLVPLGNYLEAGAGIGFTNRTVDTIYDDFVRPDGSEIEQQLKLRVIPVTATIRLLPLGNSGGFQPYVGGGIAAYNWRYVETGDFIDFSLADRPVFRDSFVASDWTLGPVVVFGARFPVGEGSIGAEARYQKAKGDLDERDFLAPTIDIGGWHVLATFGVRF
jgi:hypothetical protein